MELIVCTAVAYAAVLLNGWMLVEMARGGVRRWRRR